MADLVSPGVGNALTVHDTEIDAVKVVQQVRRGDDRGWFSRAWCAREMAAAGLDARLAQVNVSSTAVRGTVRGLHLQRGPHAESKLVHVLHGAILDVAVDVRPGSPTRHQHVARELTADNGMGLYIPMGFAHGFQTLTDDVVMLYVMSEFYEPGAESGLAHDDPAFAIPWPLPVSVLSDKDARHPHVQE